MQKKNENRKEKCRKPCRKPLKSCKNEDECRKICRKLLHFRGNSIIIKMHPNNVKKIIVELESVTPSDQSDLFVFNFGQATNKNKIKNISFEETKGVEKDRGKNMAENDIINTATLNDETKVADDTDNDAENIEQIIAEHETAENVQQDAETDIINQDDFETSPFYPLDGKSTDYLIVQFELDKFVPVNLDKLLKYYNITLRASDFKDVEGNPVIAQNVGKRGSVLGRVKEENNQIYIYFKKDDSIHRQRFTIAHELAHCCLNARQLSVAGHVEYRLDLEKPQLNGDEYDANVFAGELLIPKTIIDNIYKVVPKPNVKALAELFDVSENVMENRLKYLNREYKNDEAFDFRNRFEFLRYRTMLEF